MSIVSEFQNAAVGRVAAVIVGIATFIMGAGGYAYSAFYAHGTPSEEGMRRRGEFCQRDYQGCATDRNLYIQCLQEKSILGQSARMNAFILMTLGTLVLSATAAPSLIGRKPPAPPPSPPEVG